MIEGQQSRGEQDAKRSQSLRETAAAEFTRNQARQQDLGRAGQSGEKANGRERIA